MLPLLVALALSADPVPGDEPPPVAEEESVEPAGDEEPRLDLKLWGGQAWSDSGAGGRSEAYGAEATWRFDPLDVGLFGGCYELRQAGDTGTPKTWFAPVYLARLGQRFETRNGLLANFTLGIGAAKTAGWQSWFQVALGARAAFGPAFVAGELSFESENFLRLSLGLGVSVF